MNQPAGQHFIDFYYKWILGDTDSRPSPGSIAAVLKGRPPGRIWPASLPFVAPELLFPYYVFWLGRHVYTGTCLHANDTKTAGSFTAASATLNFHFRFRSSSRIYTLLAVSNWKWRVPNQPPYQVFSENLQLKEAGVFPLLFYFLPWQHSRLWYVGDNIYFDLQHLDWHVVYDIIVPVKLMQQTGSLPANTFSFTVQAFFLSFLLKPNTIESQNKLCELTHNHHIYISSYSQTHSRTIITLTPTEYPRVIVPQSTWDITICQEKLWWRFPILNGVMRRRIGIL